MTTKRGRSRVNKARKKKEKNDFPVQGPRGMHDMLPQDQKYWEYVAETAKMVFRGWDFRRIDTPMVEETKLFVRSVGEDTDIVSKELFELKSRGSGAKYCLRPENTASIVRAFIEHGMRSWPKPVKLYYLGPFFRYDRPQAGRTRQFHQLGLEVFGSSSPATEVELIYITYVLLRQLGLEDFHFQINSLGQDEDRKDYIKVLKEHYKRNRQKLCKDCKERLSTNPLRVLDCKEEKCAQVANTAPRMIDHLSNDAKEHFNGVLTMLDGLELSYDVTPSLVRGLDYYTQTVWEVVPSGGDNEELPLAQSSLGGGGRYDHLVKQLGGKDIPAAGMAMGVERIIDKIKQEGIELTAIDRPQVFVAQLSGQAKLVALKIMRKLQEAQIRFAESVDRDGMQPQLKLADRLGVRWVVVVGQKEVLDKTAILRNVESGIQEVVSQEQLVNELQRRLNILSE